MLNGLFGLIKDSLKKCNDGFGLSTYGLCEKITSGTITYEPANFNDRVRFVTELSIILTGGRLAEKKRIAIVEALNSEPNSALAFELALQLIVTTPEFHSTSLVDPNATPSPNSGSVGEPKSEYKAVIHLTLEGGCDSFNLLVPESTCGQLREEYDTVRDIVALKDEELLSLGGDASGQPCSHFAVHRSLPVLQELYQDEDLVFLANVGVLDVPVTKEDYKIKSVTQLFAHNTMQREVTNLDPYNEAVGTGALGRIADTLEAAGFQTGRTTVDSKPGNLAGASATGSPIVTLDGAGINEFIKPQLTNVDATIATLNGKGESLDQSGLYGGVWSSILSNALEQNEDLYTILTTTTPQNQFPDGNMGDRFKLISQLITNRVERKVDRDFFFVTMSGYDTHGDTRDTLDYRFTELNQALKELVAELKTIGVWDSVTIVQTSDFGRTLSGNSGEGTDHGWGGNYFVAGGAVRGNRILGKYPETLLPGGDLILDRGRVIPSTSWDSVFSALAQWVGVSDDKLNSVLPNRKQFNTNGFLTKEDLFGVA